jgi:hypothetical protein
MPVKTRKPVISAKIVLTEDAKELLTLMMKRTNANPDGIFDFAIRSWVDTWADNVLTASEKKKYEKVL